MLPNDALTAIPFLADLEAKGFIEGFDLVFTTPAQVKYMREQTSVFIATYRRRPVAKKLGTLPRKHLLSSTAHFLPFKSRTDPRVRGAGGSRPSSLSHEQAMELAADIVAVAEFYGLPLDMFLGIGAMENNLSIRGDINHAIWKKKPAKGDIILKRRRYRVLVGDYSIGVWQITRETLRYAHVLFLKDKRDCSQLPERLRPPKRLELDLRDSHALTTYAGLLLRDLLDGFNWDVEKAVGAYNGGPRSV